MKGSKRGSDDDLSRTAVTLPCMGWMTASCYYATFCFCLFLFHLFLFITSLISANLFRFFYLIYKSLQCIVCTDPRDRMWYVL